MSAGDEYRVKAADLTAKAKSESHESVRTELETLALGYLRLATQADRNAIPTDLVYETPPRPAG